MTKTCATKVWLSIVCLIAKPAWLILTIVYCLSQRNRVAQYLYSQLDTGGHASTGNLFTASMFEFLWSSRCLFLRWSVWVFWRATSWLCSRLQSTKFAAPTSTTARGNTISVSVKFVFCDLTCQVPHLSASCPPYWEVKKKLSNMTLYEIWEPVFYRKREVAWLVCEFVLLNLKVTLSKSTKIKLYHSKNSIYKWVKWVEMTSVTSL